MKTVIINLYSLSELSEEAKSKAIAEHASLLLSQGDEMENEAGELETIYRDDIEDSEVIESIEANEYLFFKNGDMARCTNFTGTHKRTGETALFLHGEEYLVKD